MGHPDRHSSASEEEKKDHETKFKEVGEAYAILSDEKKRRMYDSGQDLEDEGWEEWEAWGGNISSSEEPRDMARVSVFSSAKETWSVIALTLDLCSIINIRNVAQLSNNI